MNYRETKQVLSALFITLTLMSLTVLTYGQNSKTPQQTLVDGKEILITTHYMSMGHWENRQTDSLYITDDGGFQKVTFLLQNDCLYTQWGTEGKVKKSWWVRSTQFEGCDCWNLENGTRFCLNYEIEKIAWYKDLKDRRYNDVIWFNKMDLIIRDKD